MMGQSNSKHVRDSNSLLTSNDDNDGNYGAINDDDTPVVEETRLKINDVKGESWRDLRPVGTTELEIATISRDIVNDIVDGIMGDDIIEEMPCAPFKLGLTNMKIDDMSEVDKIKMYDNLNLAISRSLYTSMKFSTICEICQCKINIKEGLHIIKPEIAHKVYDMYHCEGDVMGCNKCYDDLHKDKRFIKAMNVIYLIKKKSWFNWNLEEPKQKHIRIKRSSGDIENDWIIDEKKCLLIKSGFDMVDIELYCHKDTQDGLPYKVIMYNEVKEYNPWVKIVIEESKPEKYTEHILCYKVIKTIKNLNEEFKSYI